MAQIRIEEKKTNWLPWIIGVLVLGLLVWGVAEAFEESDEYTAAVDVDEEYVPVSAVNADVVAADEAVYVDYDLYRPAVTKFMDYTVNMQGEMGLDHEFSHNALTYLAEATENVADAYDVEITNNTMRAKQLADEITKDPYATNHADKIRMAALQITETMERIDKWALDGAAKDEISNLRKEAQAINGKTLTLNQKEDVRSFFAAARTVLEQLD